MVGIIIKDRPGRYGQTRSEQEENLRKDGLGSLTDEQLDKLKWAEKNFGTRMYLPPELDRLTE